MASGFEFQSPDSRGPHFLIMLSAGRQLEKTHEKDIINASNQRNQTVIKSQDMLYYSREKSKTCFVGGSVSRTMLTYSGVGDGRLRRSLGTLCLECFKIPPRRVGQELTKMGVGLLILSFLFPSPSSSLSPFSLVVCFLIS